VPPLRLAELPLEEEADPSRSFSLGKAPDFDHQIGESMGKNEINMG